MFIKIPKANELKIRNVTNKGVELLELNIFILPKII